jgi:hypothetical protein
MFVSYRHLSVGYGQILTNQKALFFYGQNCHGQKSVTCLHWFGFKVQNQGSVQTFLQKQAKFSSLFFHV